MSKDEFTKLFDHMNKRFDDERLVMGHQLDSLDRWTHQVDDKISHKLTV